MKKRKRRADDCALFLFARLGSVAPRSRPVARSQRSRDHLCAYVLAVDRLRPVRPRPRSREQTLSTKWLSFLSFPSMLTCRIQRKYTPIAPLYDHVLLPSLAFIRAFESESLLIMGNPGVASPPSALSSSPSPFDKLVRQGEEIAFGENTYEKGFFGQSGVWAPLAGKVGDCGEKEGAWSGKVSMEVIKVRPSAI